jgi:hypothetical protein
MISQLEFDCVKDLPKAPKLGKVNLSLEYFVDLNDASMVEHAKECIIEDLQSMIKYNEAFNYIAVDEAPESTYDDIPEFLKECCEEEYQ